MFCLVTFLQSLILPSVALALTSGPTAPETTSFEPVDATDMVNLNTGNFTYNVPLLEVPGPEGGYPLSLAYHGGVKPLTDASWVGLGWSMSPGAINRIVNGWPDDHKNVVRSVTDYWSGGVNQSFSVGVAVGLPSGAASLGLDISVSHDTYRGFGGDVGLSASFGIGGKDSPFSASVGVTAGSSGYGANVGLGYTTKMGATLGVGASIHSEGGASLGVSARMARASIGASLSSRGLRPQLSIAGNSIPLVNNNAGRISTSTGGFNLPIPIKPGIWLNVGYSYHRYWMLEKDQVQTYGTLYARDSYTWSEPTSNAVNSSGPTQESMDSYALLEPGANNGVTNPDKQLGGSFPSYDAYQVSGQGISGSMQPYIFENGSLFRKRSNKVNSGGGVDAINTNFGIDEKIKRTPNFRFLNDFSNTMNMGSIGSSNLSFSSNFNLFSSSTFNTPNPSASAPSGYPAGFEYSASESHLSGSKHIETFKNSQIADAISGNYSVPGLSNYKQLSVNDRREFVVTEENIEDQIGAYAVTNENGMTYHYTIPVYTYGEHSESVRTNPNGSVSQNLQDNPHPYAYTWLLTAITGPDYQDRGAGGDGEAANGIVDDNDWGYWVSFEYGKWTDDYQWRTPSVGETRDIYDNVKTFSSGHKQIYYLDAIKTRSHTALFVKEIRNDGKGVSHCALGGFDYGEETDLEYAVLENCGNYTELCIQRYYVETTVTSVMKLNEILLFKNSDFNGTNSGLNTLRSDGPETYSQTYSHDFDGLSGCLSPGCSYNYLAGNFWETKYHNEELVIDADDMTANSSLVAKAIRRIQLNTDYSLSPHTPNSFANSGVYQDNPSIPSNKTGKLTLNSVTFKGQANTTVMPPLNFVYDIPAVGPRNWQIDNLGLKIFGNAGLFPGSIVKATYNGTTYYFRVKQRIVAQFGSETFAYELLGPNTPPSFVTGSGLVKTKNPPFTDAKYDYWGYYKSDFEGSAGTNNTSKARAPSDDSADHVDVWSMREVETSLGAKIKVDYGHKEISNNVLKYDKDVYNIKSIDAPNWNIQTTYGSGFDCEVEFLDNFNLNEAFSVNEYVGIMYPATYSTDANFSGTTFNNNWSIEKRTARVTAINSNTIDLEVQFDPTPEHTCVSNVSLQTGQNIYVYIGEFGHVESSNNGEMVIGDGVQVDAITIEQSDGDERTTHYNYSNGTTTYEPVGFDDQKAAYTFNGYGTPCQYDWYRDQYVGNLFEDLFSIAREVPAPGTMYEVAEVSESVNGTTIPGKRRYQFRVFDSNMVKYVATTTTNRSSGMKSRAVTLHDKTAQVGNLVSMEHYNSENQLIYKTTNNYVDENLVTSSTEYENDYDSQGVIEQAFNEIRFTYGGSFSNLGWSVMSKRIEYPSILKSTVEFNDGISLTSYNRKYDFYSGEIIEVEKEDGYGLHYLTRTVPAYLKYPGMGLKSVSNFDHMLTQKTASYTYRSNGSGTTLGNPLAASVTTWNEDWKYRELQSNGEYLDGTSVDTRRAWRKHKTYVFKDETNPDGTFKNWNPSGSSDFNWANPSSQAIPWLRTGEIMRYDRYSKALEERGIDDVYASVKMGYDQTLPIITATPARYVEFAYSGAEDHMGSVNYFGGEVRGPSASALDNTRAHTGEYSVRLNASTRYGMNYQIYVGPYFDTPIGNQIARQKYEARVWIHEDNISTGFNYLYCNYKDFNNNSLLWQGAKISDATTIKAGEWYMIRLPIDLTLSSLANCIKIDIGTWVPSIAGNTYFDDFRFAPVEAAVTSYVYDQKTDRVTYVLDQEHLYTQYEYDQAGRLTRVYRETTDNPTGKRLVSESEYHYKRPF